MMGVVEHDYMKWKRGAKLTLPSTSTTPCIAPKAVGRLQQLQSITPKKKRRAVHHIKLIFSSHNELPASCRISNNCHLTETTVFCSGHTETVDKENYGNVVPERYRHHNTNHK
jgi:hypothetical protein